MTTQVIPGNGRRPAGTLLDPAWWARVLAPHERAGRRPAWAGLIERAVRTATPQTGAAQAALAPLIADACRELTTGAGDCLPGEHADLPAISQSFAETLGHQLTGIAARTIEQRTGERLTGGDGRINPAEPAGLAGLITRYPVLARLLGEATELATEASAELLTRFAADRAAIVAGLAGGVDPGPLVRIEAGRGDRHRRGRSVSVLEFADGRRVVYRPRDVAPHLRFTALVEWLNGAVPWLGLRTVGVLPGAGYGWLEHVDEHPLTTSAGAERFYRRQGALLALLHAVNGTDIHHENVIACGDQPVLVDVETLFHPTLPVSAPLDDPAASALADSVYRTCLLPRITVEEHGTSDTSGLGGDRRGLGRSRHRAGRNRPRLAGREIDPGDHEAALLDGFRTGYDAIARNRAEFTALITSCADIEVRVVVRPTRDYVALLDETTRPDLLGDALDRDRLLGMVRTSSAHDPLRSLLSLHELADLRVGDIPYFSGRPASRDLWTSDGQRLPDVLDRTGSSAALDKVAGMGAADRRDQEWIISATLATRRPAGDHRSVEPLPGPVAGVAADPQRLLAAACAVADQIVARSIGGTDRVNWMSFELVDDRQWLVLPMGGGLANGYLGVALFLAQLSEVSGVARYGYVARRAIGVAGRLLEVLSLAPAMVSAIGCGGLHGFGGVAYALARLGTLLGDAEVHDWARTAVGMAATAAEVPGQPGWATGEAGCLAAMTAVRAELGLAPAARLASLCADRLVERIDRGDPLPGGFADGAAGISYALERFASANTDRRYRRAADTAARLACAPAGGFRHGWCSGTAGVALARARLGAAADLDSLVGSLADRPVPRDLSLCHGELGIAEVLTVLATPAARPARQRRAGLVLDAIGRYGASCGTPGGVATPGVLSGLAGIGYGLLRLGFAGQVPSMLLLEPSS